MSCTYVLNCNRGNNKHSYDDDDDDDDSFVCQFGTFQQLIEPCSCALRRIFKICLFTEMACTKEADSAKSLEDILRKYEESTHSHFILKYSDKNFFDDG